MEKSKEEKIIEMNLRCPGTGEGIKPPKAAAVKSRGAERLGKASS
jgi:hypothetical protein